MRTATLLILMLAACDRPGELGEPCKPDGTCNAPTLLCSAVYLNKCGVRPEPRPKPSCLSDADCFCEQCLKRCGDAGVKLCAYTDVSVWGSKPTVCECRQ